jgi:hypothetical protein
MRGVLEIEEVRGSPVVLALGYATTCLAMALASCSGQIRSTSTVVGRDAATSVVGVPAGDAGGKAGLGGDTNDVTIDSGTSRAQMKCGSTRVDTQTDNGNCGGCGLACASDCKRERYVTTLASALSFPTALAVHGDNVYFADAVGIEKVPKTGDAPPELLVKAQLGLVSRIAVDDRFVYVPRGSRRRTSSFAIPTRTPASFSRRTSSLCS